MSTVPVYGFQGPAPYGYPAGYGGTPAQIGAAQFDGAQYGAAQYRAAAAQGIERQVVPEYVQVPVTQTVMVPQTTYQQRYVQVPVQQTVQVPRVVSSLSVVKNRFRFSLSICI
jgi:hypothetical protein